MKDSQSLSLEIIIVGDQDVSSSNSWFGLSCWQANQDLHHRSYWVWKVDSFIQMIINYFYEPIEGDVFREAMEHHNLQKIEVCDQMG